MNFFRENACPCFISVESRRESYILINKVEFFKTLFGIVVRDKNNVLLLP